MVVTSLVDLDYYLITWAPVVSSQSEFFGPVYREL
jgi:hypothetical protein